VKFSERFAAARGVDPKEVENRVLLAGLPWFWRQVAFISGGWKNPSALGPDRGLVRQCLVTESAKEVLVEVKTFHYRELHFVPVWRRLTGFRVSGQRLLRIAESVFRD
jgi:hypothetical protein